MSLCINDEIMAECPDGNSYSTVSTGGQSREKQRVPFASVSFDATKSRREAERDFDCQTLAPVKE